MVGVIKTQIDLDYTLRELYIIKRNIDGAQRRWGKSLELRLIYIADAMYTCTSLIRNLVALSS
jgi:hypothetical protein